MTIRASSQAEADHLRFVSLEITGRCQLSCEHCYASSGPRGEDGTMTTGDWLDVISQMADLGVERAQLIGGEPTMHRDFPILLDALLNSGMEVEVYSNMYRVSPANWTLFDRPGVRLATSYYSSDAAEHDRITGRRGSHARTLANICEIQARHIPLRIGIIAIRDSQRVGDAIAELEELGVAKIDVDHVRAIGRGVGDHSDSPSELCGRCGDRKVSVSPEGDVWPCVMARWVTLGNVLTTPLRHIFEASRPSRMGLRRAMSMGCHVIRKTAGAMRRCAASRRISGRRTGWTPSPPQTCGNTLPRSSSRAEISGRQRGAARSSAFRVRFSFPDTSTDRTEKQSTG